MSVVVKIKGAWQGKSAGGCMNFPTWRYNPQIFASVAETQNVNIQLSQDIKSRFFIGLIVAKSNGKISRHLALSVEQIVLKQDHKQSQHVSADLTFEAGVQYLVIPCTFNPGEEARYQLSFSAATEVKISELPLGEEWKYVTQKGEWKGKSSGGCLNYPTCANNPQFVLKAEVPTHAVILLSQTENDENDVLGFYIFETKSVKSKLTNITPKEIRAASEFARTFEATCEFDLQPKKIYAIIPCTYDPNNDNTFELTVFSNHDIKLHELRPGTMSPAGGSAVGSGSGSGSNIESNE
jgi:hypothetical protein